MSARDELADDDVRAAKKLKMDDLQTKTDEELKELISTNKRNIGLLELVLPNKAQALKEAIKSYEDEIHRRAANPLRSPKKTSPQLDKGKLVIKVEVGDHSVAGNEYLSDSLFIPEEERAEREQANTSSSSSSDDDDDEDDDAGASMNLEDDEAKERPSSIKSPKRVDKLKASSLSTKSKVFEPCILRRQSKNDNLQLKVNMDLCNKPQQEKLKISDPNPNQFPNPINISYPNPQQFYPFQPNFYPQQPLNISHQQLLFNQRQQLFQQQTPQPEAPQYEGGSRKRSHKKKKDKDKVVVKTCNKKPWSNKEEEWLAECWADSSKDFKRGNSKSSLWNTIYEKFNNNNSGWVRGDDQLSSKWRNINKTCQQFKSIYNEVVRTWDSGRNDTDIYGKAVDEYRTTHSKSFNMKDAWFVLKDHPHWYDLPSVAQSETPYAAGEDTFEENEPINISEENPDTKLNDEFGEDPIPQLPERAPSRKVARSSASSDAATSSRGTNSLKMDEMMESMSHFMSEMVAAGKKAVDTFTNNERTRTALQGAQLLTISTANVEDSTDVQRINRMKAYVRREFKDYFDGSDEDEK
ncbi:uncharacterized protein [Rutidosis leptorrhynchoides]|uniref:uncharacterized protein isoform X2 n=1 Tax=Rutidosis leptorrhynchoides TaxID=125765 RepID=UPI003A99F7F1